MGAHRFVSLCSYAIRFNVRLWSKTGLWRCFRKCATVISGTLGVGGGLIPTALRWVFNSLFNTDLFFGSLSLSLSLVLPAVLRLFIALHNPAASFTTINRSWPPSNEKIMLLLLCTYSSCLAWVRICSYPEKEGKYLAPLSSWLKLFARKGNAGHNDSGVSYRTSKHWIIRARRLDWGEDLRVDFYWVGEKIYMILRTLVKNLRPVVNAQLFLSPQPERYLKLLHLKRKSPPKHTGTNAFLPPYHRQLLHRTLPCPRCRSTVRSMDRPSWNLLHLRSDLRNRLQLQQPKPSSIWRARLTSSHRRGSSTDHCHCSNNYDTHPSGPTPNHSHMHLPQTRILLQRARVYQLLRRWVHEPVCQQADCVLRLGQCCQSRWERMRITQPAPPGPGAGHETGAAKEYGPGTAASER